MRRRIRQHTVTARRRLEMIASADDDFTSSQSAGSLCVRSTNFGPNILKMLPSWKNHSEANPDTDARHSNQTPGFPPVGVPVLPLATKADRQTHRSFPTQPREQHSHSRSHSRSHSHSHAADRLHAPPAPSPPARSPVPSRPPTPP